MASKQQVFNVLAAASGPMSRVQIAEKVGEEFRKFQTQMERWMGAGFIEDKGDEHYVLTEKGREKALEAGEFKDIELEPGLQKEESEETEVSLGATEYQKFLQFGKRIGVTPLNLIKVTADHIWDGGDYKDLVWVAKGMQEMDIQRDLRGRWFNRWRSYLKQGIPTDLPPEFFPSEHKMTDEKGDGQKEKGTGKRDYILDEEDKPAFVGEGNGDLDYKDALDLSKIRNTRRNTVPQTAGSMAEEVGKMFATFKEIMGDKAEGKSWVMRQGEDGNIQIQEAEPGHPMVISYPQGNKPQPTVLVNPDGDVQEVQPGQPIIIKQPAPVQPSQSMQYLIDRHTGDMQQVQPGQPIIIQTTPPNLMTPIQFDQEGNPMTPPNLETWFKLENWKVDQQRKQESHETKMEIAKGFKELLKKAESAVSHIAEGEE